MQGLRPLHPRCFFFLQKKKKKQKEEWLKFLTSSGQPLQPSLLEGRVPRRGGRDSKSPQGGHSAGMTGPEGAGDELFRGRLV